MPKKYEISKEAQVLLRLLRIALGTEPMAADGTTVEPFPQAIDWREVIRLSYEQKVSALAVDGLKASGYDPLLTSAQANPQLASVQAEPQQPAQTGECQQQSAQTGESPQQAADLQPAFASWFDDVKNSEESYAYYLTVLSTLCQIFSANGLKTIILKGYGAGLNYPFPSHRGCGDIDFYLLDENDKPAGRRGDELLQGQYVALFHKMEHQNSYHTQYSFKGIVIENHYSIIGEFHDKGKEQFLGKHLEALIAEGYTPAPDVEGAYLPSARFTALHLMRHSFAHCYFGGLNLRQLVDLYTFMRKVEGQEILNGDILDRTGLAIFADCVKDVMRVVFEGKVAQNPASQMIIGDMFIPRQDKGGIRNFFHWYHDRRKIRFLTGESWVKLTARSVVGHMLGEEK